jgi:lactoylglutathione lyase
MQLNLVVLKTGQLERVMQFYAALGLNFQSEQHGQGPHHYSASCGEVLLEIYPLTDSAQQADQTTRLGFRVTDLQQSLLAIQAFSEKPLPAPKPSPWGLRSVVSDPDGRAVELTQPN